MKESSLQPGDKVGQWTVDHHIANGCIYAVKMGEGGKHYAMKIREPNNQQWLRHEVRVLKRLNKDHEDAYSRDARLIRGQAHISFQALIDYNIDDPENLYVVTNLGNPDRRLSQLPDHTLRAINPFGFTSYYFEACLFALSRGVIIDSMNGSMDGTIEDHTVVLRGDRPFILDRDLDEIIPEQDIEQYIQDLISSGELLQMLTRLNKSILRIWEVFSNSYSLNFNINITPDRAYTK